MFGKSQMSLSSPTLTATYKDNTMTQEQDIASLYTGIDNPTPVDLTPPKVGQTFKGPQGTLHRVQEVTTDEEGTTWVRYVNTHNRAETTIRLEGWAHQGYDCKDPE